MSVHTPADYLELARTESDSAVLHRLARCPYPFVSGLSAVLLPVCAVSWTGTSSSVLDPWQSRPAADGTILT